MVVYRSVVGAQSRQQAEEVEMGIPCRTDDYYGNEKSKRWSKQLTNRACFVYAILCLDRNSGCTELRPVGDHRISTDCSRSRGRRHCEAEGNYMLLIAIIRRRRGENRRLSLSRFFISCQLSWLLWLLFLQHGCMPWIMGGNNNYLPSFEIISFVAILLCRYRKLNSARFPFRSESAAPRSVNACSVGN